jgi:hypothetical protein
VDRVVAMHPAEVGAMHAVADQALQLLGEAARDFRRVGEILVFRLPQPA